MTDDPTRGKTFNFPGRGQGGGVFCGCCLGDTAELRTDVKGRPYTWCGDCRSRTFIGSDRGLLGIRFFSGDRLQALLHAVQGAPAGASQGEGVAVPVGAAVKATG